MKEQGDGGLLALALCSEDDGSNLMDPEHQDKLFVFKTRGLKMVGMLQTGNEGS